MISIPSSNVAFKCFKIEQSTILAIVCRTNGLPKQTIEVGVFLWYSGWREVHPTEKKGTVITVNRFFLFSRVVLHFLKIDLSLC